MTLDLYEKDSTNDAGLVRLASTGNFVWIDKNGNGIQDEGEEGRIRPSLGERSSRRQAHVDGAGLHRRCLRVRVRALTVGFVATDEQRDIIEAPLEPLCVMACPGSGKTATAVRRLAHVRAQLERSRGWVLLLSYSNTAVETFYKQYHQLASASPVSSDRVAMRCASAASISSSARMADGERMKARSRAALRVRTLGACAGAIAIGA